MFFGEFDRDMILGRLYYELLWKFLFDLWIFNDRKIILCFIKVDLNGIMDKFWEFFKILMIVFFFYLDIL